MTAFELRMYPRALQELQASLDDPRRPLPVEQREQVTRLIEETKAFVGRYELQSNLRMPSCWSTACAMTLPGRSYSVSGSTSSSCERPKAANCGAS